VGRRRGGNPLRVLNAGQTFYLAQALLMAIYLRRRARSRRLWNAMAAILAVTIVLLQHRSVWVALAIAAAAVAWREGALRRLLLWTAALALIAGCAMLPMAERFSRGNTVAESIGASIAEPFDPEKARSPGASACGSPICSNTPARRWPARSSERPRQSG